MSEYGGGGGSVGSRLTFRKQKTPLPLDSPLSCGNRYAIREGVDTEGQQVHWFKAILRPVS